MFTLTIEQRKQLLQYFWTRPYGEVAALVNMLAALQEKNQDKDDKNKKNPDILNYLGYTLRKTGNFEKAEKFYQEGLKLDSGHLGINEYLGELYVQTGRIDLAKERLQTLYGCECEEYEELKELIEKN